MSSEKEKKHMCVFQQIFNKVWFQVPLNSKPEIQFTPSTNPKEFKCENFPVFSKNPTRKSPRGHGAVVFPPGAAAMSKIRRPSGDSPKAAVRAATGRREEAWDGGDFAPKKWDDPQVIQRGWLDIHWKWGGCQSEHHRTIASVFSSTPCWITGGYDQWT